MFKDPFARGLVVVMLRPVDTLPMVRVSITEAVAGVDSESVTVMLTVNVPVWLVVPEIVALGVPEVEVSPVGRPEMVQVYGVTPPAAVVVAV